MSSRILIPALCVGAIALACGPRAHEASTPQQKSSATIVQAGTVHTASRTQSATPHLTARLSVQPREASAQFALHVTNDGKKGVELTFPSGQTYDFVVMDSVGRE